MKDAGLRIRVQRDLRERFLSVCLARDKLAARVLREFMRDYVTGKETSVIAGDTTERGGRAASITGRGQS